ncbi:MAG: hypothetical protein R3F43_29665 [bacterium]
MRAPLSLLLAAALAACDDVLATADATIVVDLGADARGPGDVLDASADGAGWVNDVRHWTRRLGWGAA